MGTVVANASLSLDGYVAKADNSIGRLFDWYEAGDVEVTTGTSGLTFHLTPASAADWREWTAGLGAIVCGRTRFDLVDGWGGRHTMDAPVVVVTHRRPTEWVRNHPDARFEFVTTGVSAAPIEDVPLGDPDVCIPSARVTHLRMPVLRPDPS